MVLAKITRHVRPEHVSVRLHAETKDAAVRELAGLLATSGTLTAAKAEALGLEVLGREGEGTTGIGGGVAVPHAKTQLVKDLVVAVGLSEAGLDFSSVDGDPVHVVFLIAAPPNASVEYLALMKWVVSLTRSRYWMKLVRACSTPEALVEVLDESDVGGMAR
jgi:mannitol/fructose-specific phosphotransferase system IIA component (Ntr-type)